MTSYVLVGLDNPHCDDPRLALYPTPAGATGARLVEMTGLSRNHYLRAFVRVNLYDHPVPRSTAGDAARAEELVSRISGPLRVVCLGRRVARAFGCADRWLEWRPYSGSPVKVRVAAVPHPSGRNRWYNEVRQATRARVFLGDVAAEALRASLGASGGQK